MTFYQERDFELSARGTFRGASRTESIRQDVIHMLQEQEAIGEPGDTTAAAELRRLVVDLLSGHPNVQTIQQVAVEASETNQVFVLIFVNGDPSAITVTAGG